MTAPSILAWLTLVLLALWLLLRISMFTEVCIAAQTQELGQPAVTTPVSCE